MSNIVYLKTPLTDNVIESLRIGDKVYISGIIYTARDAAHKRLVELIDNGKELPLDIKNQIIYYVGPSPAILGKPVGSCVLPLVTEWMFIRQSYWKRG